MTTAETARVPLRWAGSKRKSLSRLRALVPSEFDTYVEPFFGSGCLFFSLAPRKAVISDINPQLSQFYRTLQRHPENLHDYYRRLPDDRESYYKIRARFAAEKDKTKAAAIFLYLNRLCFNGIYRVNSRGEFNVPYGDRPSAKLTKRELLAASQALKGVRVLCGDFESAVRTTLAKGAFYYLDPPFAHNERRVFTEYHASSFSTQDWPRLLGLLKDIDRAGAKFALSYMASRDFIRASSNWDMQRMAVTRNVAGFSHLRRKAFEVVLTN